MKLPDERQQGKTWFLLFNTVDTTDQFKQFGLEIFSGPADLYHIFFIVSEYIIFISLCA